MVSKKKAKTKNGVRFDSKHIRLRTGESEKDNGTYVYRWTDKSENAMQYMLPRWLICESRKNRSS